MAIYVLLVVTTILPGLGAVLTLACLRVDKYLGAMLLSTLVSIAARIPLAALLTGVFYFEAACITNAFNHHTPANVVWLAGIPAAAAAAASRRNKLRACVLFLCIIVPGMAATWMLELITRIPLID
jgi:hypothetical protein